MGPPLMRQLLHQCKSLAVHASHPKSKAVIFRPLSTISSPSVQKPSPPPASSLLGAKLHILICLVLERSATAHPRSATKKARLPVPPPLPAPQIKDPLSYFTAQQLQSLDPSGARTSLFSRTNRDRARVGDILLVRFRNGDPFAGVCLNIRRRGVDTGILLRNQLTRIGVELWVKVYSPNVEGVELVRRYEKKRRARRARLYYLRKPKHDVGSVEGVVQNYLRQRAALGGSAGGVGGGGGGADGNESASGEKRQQVGRKRKGRR
ncbi:MAG: hypothetical protein M1837_001427 [Sclerophora amabilis]|nr:MAG: hypothetical protein M1837_001427 [Sclerophora amabilis]